MKPISKASSIHSFSTVLIEETGTEHAINSRGLSTQDSKNTNDIRITQMEQELSLVKLAFQHIIEIL